MKDIGGYFGFELKNGNEFHSKVVRLNSGRNCLDYFLEIENVKEIFISHYSCPELIEKINNRNIKIHFYKIDENFEILNLDEYIDVKCFFMYTNYFGLKNSYVLFLSKFFQNNILIIDNAQSFFSSHLDNIATFYSPRKFFGVPDGGYLYYNKNKRVIKADNSLQSFKHLLLGADKQVNKGYNYYKKNEELIKNKPTLGMSEITRKILKSIDYKKIKNARRKNFQVFHESLEPINKIKLNIEWNDVPYFYPLMVYRQGLRQHLIKNRIYVPKLWPKLNHLKIENKYEYNFVNYIIPLPIDHRIYKRDCLKIIKVIIEFLKNDKKK
jgi:hypothetical protein